MHPNTPIRRTHSAQFKAQVLAACRQPGASVSAVALTHGLNVNVVRKWLAGRGMKRCTAGALRQHSLAPAPQPMQFVAVDVAAPALGCAPSPDIRLDLDLGALQLKLLCARAAAATVAALLHSLAEMVARA
jgi:transposase